MADVLSGVELWQQAANFAARQHVGHLRKDQKTPYIAHVFRVAMTVRDVFGHDDPQVLAAALLHDAIEDTRTDYDDLIDAGFPTFTADLVAALSKDTRMPHDPREEAYYEQLAAAPWQARLIKLADVYDNFSDAPAADKREHPEAVAKASDHAERVIAISKNDPQLKEAIKHLRARLAK